MANDQTNDQNPTITRTRTPILIAAMRLLSKEIQSEDGVANAAIAEAADRLEELEAGIGDEITRPHDGPENCPTYHDGCNCTVEVLVHNIERAEKAEARIDDLSRAYAVQGLALEDFQTRVAELETQKGGYARDWDICMDALEKITDLIPDLNTLGEAVEIANAAINATLPKPE